MPTYQFQLFKPGDAERFSSFDLLDAVSARIPADKVSLDADLSQGESGFHTHDLHGQRHPYALYLTLQLPAGTTVSREDARARIQDSFLSIGRQDIQVVNA